MSDSVIEHLSERPWSDYTAADYTVEQWHRACLIHQHDGAPTSKGECKLPVRTPNGAVNRNAVHSAAAALAGARGGVHASSEEKASAARALLKLYSQMDEKPPASLASHSNFDVLEHYGVKGMRWGVRTKGRRASSGPARTTYTKKGSKLSNDELQKRIKRMELEKRYNDLNKAEPTKVSRGSRFASAILSNAGRNVLTTIATGAGLLAVSQMLKKQMGPETAKALTGK